MLFRSSAFFGPAKYGILPEMFRGEDLPQVNGVIQMTTFLAIIFGVALAGFLKDWFDDRLWLVGAICIVIAGLGTLSSLAVRKTPVAHPGLPFRIDSLAINRETWLMLRGDRKLVGVLPGIVAHEKSDLSQYKRPVEKGCHWLLASKYKQANSLRLPPCARLMPVSRTQLLGQTSCPWHPTESRSSFFNGLLGLVRP